MDLWDGNLLNYTRVDVYGTLCFFLKYNMEGENLNP